MVLTIHIITCCKLNIAKYNIDNVHEEKCIPFIQIFFFTWFIKLPIESVGCLLQYIYLCIVIFLVCTLHFTSYVGFIDEILDIRWTGLIRIKLRYNYLYISQSFNHRATVVVTVILMSTQCRYLDLRVPATTST